MSEAAEVLGPYPVEVQSRAVRRWRESGGSISFQQALQEVMRGKEVEEEPIKSRAEGGEGAVEEVEVEKPSEAALQQILSKVEEKPKEERIGNAPNTSRDI